MTLGGLKPDLSGRIGALLLSAALHAAAGVALLHPNDQQGMPVHAAAAGDAGMSIPVELVSFERAGSPPDDSALGRDAPPSEHPSNPLPADPDERREKRRGPLAPEAGTNDTTASSAGQEDTRQMADLPNSEALAYRQRLESHLARYRVYPVGARTAAQQGVVTVYFTMTRDGRVLKAWVETSSGVSDLDAEALAAVIRAQPLPRYPESWPAQLDVSLPVTFRLG